MVEHDFLEMVALAVGMTKAAVKHMMSIISFKMCLNLNVSKSYDTFQA